MHNRYTSLQFIIALFFALMGAILLIGYFSSTTLHVKINLYTGSCFLVFALFMALVRGKETND